MEKMKLVKKLQTNKTVNKFGSIVILTCMAVLFASSIIQPAFSYFTFALGSAGVSAASSSLSQSRAPTAYLSRSI